MEQVEKKLSEITRKEWIRFQWVDITQMGDQERYMLRGYKRTPDEAMEAMEQWDSVQDALSDEDDVDENADITNAEKQESETPVP